MQYIKKPQGYFQFPSSILEDNLPPGYYSVDFDSNAGQYFLAPAKPYKLVSKVYGDSLKHADRIINTFMSREGINTSAVFEGLKGSGKTLLAKVIAHRIVELGGIVINVGAPFTGDAFNSFIQGITQTKVVLIDEFEKTYADRDARNGLLTLLDGTWQSHSLFLLTTNTDMYYDTGMEFFTNRPGRVYFNIKFKATDIEAITEYCKDNLEDQDKLSTILKFVRSFRAFNMDMLSVLTHEVNINPELSLEELSEFLNIKPDATLNDRIYDMKVYIKGELLDASDYDYSSYSLTNFLSTTNERSFSITAYGYTDDEVVYSFDYTDISQCKETGVITLSDSTNIPDVKVVISSTALPPRPKLLF